MKTITVIDPDSRLRATIINPTHRWVQTCHSDTCGCMSHDSGYYEWSGQVPDHVEVARRGASVHGHGTSYIISDTEGRLEHDAAHWAACCRNYGPIGCIAAERCYATFEGRWKLASRVLELFRQGMAEEAARQQAEQEAAQAAKDSRKAIRANWVENMVKAGLTPSEAHLAYGIGPWCKEIDWPNVKRAIEAMSPVKWDMLTRAIQATSRKEAMRLTSGLFGENCSHPRLTAWAGYVVAVFS